MRQITCISLILLSVLAMSSECMAGKAEHEVLRKQARQAFSDGNWKDAYLLYHKLCLATPNDPKLIGNDLVQAWQCLRRLNRLNELDAFREKVIEKHYHNWRLVKAAADSYSRNNHWGYMIAGEFHRGQHRGGGRYVTAIRRDRVRALQLLNQALIFDGGGAVPQRSWRPLSGVRPHDHPVQR